MTQQELTAREFVSKALSYALRNSEKDFSEELSLYEDKLHDALEVPVAAYFNEYIKNYINNLDDVNVTVDGLLGAYNESETFIDSLSQEISNAIYNAQQAAREAFFKYFATTADTDALAADLLNHLSD